MVFVRYSGDKYEFCVDRCYFQFDEKGQHDHLFRYISVDLSQLSALLEQYIAKRIDITTFELTGYQNDEDYNEITGMLKPIHKYYEYESDEVLLSAIDDYFSTLLFHSNYRDIYPEKSDDEWKLWYIERLKVLAAPAMQPADKPDKLEKLYIKHRDLIGANTHDHVEEVIITRVSKAKGFFYELETQEIVKRMLFWILDLSVPYLEELTIVQRVWYYTQLFGQGTLKVDRLLSLGNSTLFRAGQDRSEEVERLLITNDIFTPLYGHASDFHLNKETISHEMLRALQCAADHAKKALNEESYDEYKITDIRQLLFLELLSMIDKSIGIRRCKNCGLYFVVTNHNKEYCDRIKDGEKRSCAAIGAKRTFGKKLKTDKVLEVYNRAYKTHHARRRTGKMSHVEFDEWCKTAKTKLEQVRNDEMDVSDFEKWAKI